LSTQSVRAGEYAVSPGLHDLAGRPIYQNLMVKTGKKVNLIGGVYRHAPRHLDGAACWAPPWTAHHTADADNETRAC
jgi:hypothetical protein